MYVKTSLCANNKSEDVGWDEFLENQTPKIGLGPIMEDTTYNFNHGITKNCLKIFIKTDF